MDEAKNWYEKATEDDTGQGNTYASTAQARLALVNAKPPTKVKPAPPAPPIPSAIPKLPTTTPALPKLTAPDAPKPSQPEDKAQGNNKPSTEEELKGSDTDLR